MSVEAVNRRHLKVVFSESVDPEVSLKTSNYSCFESATDRLLPILACTIRNPNEVDLTTAIQSSSIYTLVVSGIEDLSGNQMGPSRAEFGGSEARDPHPPKLLAVSPADGAAGFDADSGISIHFSEAMDTSSIREHCGILPAGSLKIEWNEEMREFDIFPGEIELGKVYNLYLRDACTDLEGNLLEEWTLLTFTRDSTLPGGYIKGSLHNTEGSKTIIGLADRLLTIMRIAVTSDTVYRMDWLKQESYVLLAGTDLDGDRRFDLVAHDEVTVGDEGAVRDLSLQSTDKRWRVFERLERIFTGD